VFVDPPTAVWLLLSAPIALQALHRARLLVVYAATRDRVPAASRLPDDPAALPIVTVQLPVFNERDVIARLVRAVAALDWPADRLEIQLLDDSTDDTAERAAPALAEAHARGIAVAVLRRDTREGFKAGALGVGLARAKGELLAIFDADFVPDPSFLRIVIPHLLDPDVAMVQARWGHLNADASALTAAQSVLLDGHFVIEHTARCRGGDWFNFNGTAGVWRREAIVAAGGWRADTLVEDLDLSYRAQLGGARFVYLLEHVVPSELPDRMEAFRAQQARWAKGTIEAARTLGGRVARAQAPLRTRAEALAHLWGNLAWGPSLAMAALLPVVVVTGAGQGAAVVGSVLLLGAAVNLVHLCVAAGPRRLQHVPLALALGVGLAVNQSFAVLEALRGRRTAFERTPKNGGSAGSYGSAGRHARRAAPWELLLAAAHLGALGWALIHGAWAATPFLALFAAGFGWTGGSAVFAWRRETREGRRLRGAAAGG
jgi:hypothetical protein